MFNLGGAEILVIMLLALLVLGPDKLPEAARKVGRVMSELRRLSSGFQQELRSGMNDPQPPARTSGAAGAVDGDSPASPPPDPGPDEPDQRQAS